MAEAFIKGQAPDDDAVHAEIAPCFIERAGRRTDIVVLACTHYPFLVAVFRRLAPWPVDWMDPARAIARRVKAVSDCLQPRQRRINVSPHCDVALVTSGRIDRSTETLFGEFGLAAQPMPKSRGV